MPRMGKRTIFRRVSELEPKTSSPSMSLSSIWIQPSPTFVVVVRLMVMVMAGVMVVVIKPYLDEDGALDKAWIVAEGVEVGGHHALLGRLRLLGTSRGWRH